MQATFHGACHSVRNTAALCSSARRFLHYILPTSLPSSPFFSINCI
jgi:hypothetical protein